MSARAFPLSSNHLDTDVYVVRRGGQCPLRQPRVWMWALAFALPAHVVLALALGGVAFQGKELVACPVTHVMRVALVAPEPMPSATPAPERHLVPIAEAARAAVPPREPITERKAVVRDEFAAKPTAQPQATGRQSEMAALAPAAGGAPASFGVNRSPEFLTPPPPPPYPAASRARGEAGVVHILARLVNDGAPVEVKLARSSGFDRLDGAALHAVRDWQFVARGEAWVMVPVRFVLTENN
jgi:protein TonB